jgi:predicted RNase H-like HicB family nuclease
MGVYHHSRAPARAILAKASVKDLTFLPLRNHIGGRSAYRKGKVMIRKYIQTAMEHARYEILQDDGTYYGEIQECPGVYSNAPTLEKCRNELEEVLEEWILFRVYKNLKIPPIDNIEIKIKKQAAA